MLYFEFGQDRLAEAHALKTFELGQRPIKVSFDACLVAAAEDPSGPLRRKCPEERTTT